MSNTLQVSPHMGACLHISMHATFIHSWTQKEEKLYLWWCFTVYKLNIQTFTWKGKN